MVIPTKARDLLSIRSLATLGMTTVLICVMRLWLILLLGAGACDNPVVRWSEPQAAPSDTSGLLTLGPDAAPAYPPTESFRTPADSAMCPGSARSALDQGVQFSAWLRLRPDSTVRVVAAAWDGNHWTAPATVDSLDIGKFGCRRPAPSIAVSDDGLVHVAYSIEAPEGFGVFFGHSMNRAISFHDPMIVVYGDRLSATAIASSGPRVAIAYEDPSGSIRRIQLALSETQGHTFEPRETASPDEMTAAKPRIAIRDTVIALSFAGIDSTQRALRIGYITR